MRHPDGTCARCGEPKRGRLGCGNCDQLAAMGITTNGGDDR